MLREQLIEQIKTNKYEERGSKLILTFNKPINNPFNKWIREDLINKLKIDHFYINNGTIYISNRLNSRVVSRIEPIIEHIETVELDKKKTKDFINYNDFLNQFDTSLFDVKEIEKLWQENVEYKEKNGYFRYHRTDFKVMGKQGLKIWKRFREQWKGLSPIAQEVSGVYTKGYGDTKVFSVYYRCYGMSRGKGRDITISHTLGCPYIHYSSEYAGCGNGSYGLVARNNVWLHIEDD